MPVRAVERAPEDLRPHHGHQTREGGDEPHQQTEQVSPGAGLPPLRQQAGEHDPQPEDGVDHRARHRSHHGEAEGQGEERQPDQQVGEAGRPGRGAQHGDGEQPHAGGEGESPPGESKGEQRLVGGGLEVVGSDEQERSDEGAEQPHHPAQAVG